MPERGQRESHSHTEGEVVIFEGTFSWWAAWCMMIWVLCFLASTVLMILSTRGSAFQIISEEISYVKEREVRPPYGPEEQPVVDATMREINQMFAYRLPQTALFYSLAGSSLGLFTVSYFSSFVLLEDTDQGPKRVVDIGFLISKGVNVYMGRTIPVILALLFLGGWYVMGTAGPRAVACFAVGAALNLLSAQVGVSVTVQGQTRLAHALGLELFDALQIGVRTGSIGGLLATSLALGGMAGMWLLIQVSFAMRVGGGIFSKGADIGADLVSDMEEARFEEDQKLFELQRKMAELEEDRKERAKHGLEGDDEDMMEELRKMEDQMQDIASQLHPIDYFDTVGEAINDVSGTCADLFESMVLILGTCAIIGVKGSPVPHFNAGLPFWIIASGKVGCSLVAYFVHVHERFTARRIRWSLRANLLLVIGLVQLVQVLVSFQEYLAGTISFERFGHFCVISLMGQVIPEVCVLLGEFFTSTDYSPVRSLAMNADLGIVQVVLQGFGQGFFSTGLPAVVIITCVVATWRLEQHYGLALLSASSVSGTGFQGGIASFGAIATNAHKIIHLTTYHPMSRHRANICAALGDTTAHAGNTISAVNAFSAVFNIALTLLAQAYTELDINYMNVTGSILSSYSQAGLVLGVVMTFAFAANTMISCLQTAQAFAKYVAQYEIGKIAQLPFPQSHVRPLKKLASFGTITSMRMTISPIINSLACPMIGGFFLGVKGLLFMISGSNVLVLCLSIFLINSGQSWVAARTGWTGWDVGRLHLSSGRKFVLFGLLRDKDGNVIGPDSPHYANLGIGETIGGPFEDTTGPAMNNFIKFVTGGPGRLYDELPTNTWPFGFASVVGSLSLVFFSRVGLDLLLKGLGSFLQRRKKMQAYEDGDFLRTLRVKRAREIAKQRAELKEAISKLGGHIQVIDGSRTPSAVTPELLSEVFDACYAPTQLKHGNFENRKGDPRYPRQEPTQRDVFGRLREMCFDCQVRPHQGLLHSAGRTDSSSNTAGSRPPRRADPWWRVVLHQSRADLWPVLGVQRGTARPAIFALRVLLLCSHRTRHPPRLRVRALGKKRPDRYDGYECPARRIEPGNGGGGVCQVQRRRGFNPVPTSSYHFIPDEALREEVTQLAREAAKQPTGVSVNTRCALMGSVLSGQCLGSNDLLALSVSTAVTVRTPFSHGSLVGIFEGQLTQKYEILRQRLQGKTFLVRGKSEQKSLFVAKESHEKDPYAIADLRKEFDYLKRILEASLQHPNISKVLELVLGKELEEGQWTDRLYVISELAAGSDLLQYMKKMIEHQRTLREDWMAKVLHQIMSGVAYLHSERVVHNDLKPDNILCIQEFQPDSPDLVPWVTLTDFGCAKVRDEEDFVCGDPRYQSPETLRALVAHLKGQIGYQADIWSLGVTLFELLSGGVMPFIYEAVHLNDVTHNAARWEKLKVEVMEKEPAAGHHSLSEENLARLELKKTKGMAHTLLLNAMAMKLQRSHYEESWKVFQTIDADNDGSLSLEEFQQAFELLAGSPTSGSLCKSPMTRDDPQGAWLEHIFKMADIDKNGRLNFPEFVAVTFDWNTLERSVLDGILKRLFNQLDRDGNGQDRRI
eukprot:g19624.t1